jgi:hypothetical protein
MVGILGSDLDALGAELCDDGLDALFLEGAQPVTRYLETYPALLGFEPETLRVKIRQESTPAAVVGV